MCVCCFSNKIYNELTENYDTFMMWTHNLCPAAIVYLVGALEVGLVYFPFFACLSTPCRTVGAILGIFYSLCW